MYRAAGGLAGRWHGSVHASLQRPGNHLVLGAAGAGGRTVGGTSRCSRLQEAQQAWQTEDGCAVPYSFASARDDQAMPPPTQKLHPSKRRALASVTHMTYTTAPQPARQSRSCPLSSAWLTVSNSSSGPCVRMFTSGHAAAAEDACE